MKSPPHCDFDAAFHRLEDNRNSHQANLRLQGIRKLLYSQDDFSESDLRPILEKRNHSLQVERAIELYMMMHRLTKLCEPKGDAVGPACAVQPIIFEELTLAEALELRNGIRLRVLFQLRSEAEAKNCFVGMNVLTPEEKELYERIKRYRYFAGRGKPTLKILAARLLSDSEDRSFSDRSILRYIEKLRNYEFNDDDYERDSLIRSVESFGAQNKSLRESAQDAMAQTVAQMAPVFKQLIAESAQLIAESAQLVAQATLPLLRQELRPIAQSVARHCVAELHRSLLPQTLSVLANLNFNVRQN
jgi:DNA-binding transcriptional regulator YdaS (Cro superfamily)